MLIIGRAMVAAKERSLDAANGRQEYPEIVSWIPQLDGWCTRRMFRGRRQSAAVVPTGLVCICFFVGKNFINLN